MTYTSCTLIDQHSSNRLIQEQESVLVHVFLILVV